MYTHESTRIYNNPDRIRERKHLAYLANRERILAEAAAKRAEANTAKEHTPCLHTSPCLTDPDEVADIRPFMERDRRDTLEAIRLRLIWASSAGGDEGAVAKSAVAVIRFAKGEGGRWTDRSLRALHRRLSLAEGLTPERFEAAREAVARELFVPL